MFANQCSIFVVCPFPHRTKNMESHVGHLVTQKHGIVCRSTSKQVSGLALGPVTQARSSFGDKTWTHRTTCADFPSIDFMDLQHCTNSMQLNRIIGPAEGRRMTTREGRCRLSQEQKTSRIEYSGALKPAKAVSQGSIVSHRGLDGGDWWRFFI